MSELVFACPTGLFTPPSHGGDKPKIKQYPLLAFPPPTKISPPPVCFTQREAAAVNEQVPAKKDLSTKNGFCRQSILLLFLGGCVPRLFASHERILKTLVNAPLAFLERLRRAWSHFPKFAFRSRPFPLFERSLFPFFESRLCAKSHWACLTCAFYARRTVAHCARRANFQIEKEKAFDAVAYMKVINRIIIYCTGSCLDFLLVTVVINFFLFH